MKVDACDVVRSVGAIHSLAAYYLMYVCGEYAHRAAGHASFVLTHSATSNALIILYKIV